MENKGEKIAMLTLKQILTKKIKKTGFLANNDYFDAVREWLQQKQKENQDNLFHTIGISELLEDLEEKKQQ